MQNRTVLTVLAAVLLTLCFERTVLAQGLEILTRPDAIYVERMEGNITPMDRVFFHIILDRIQGSLPKGEFVEP